MDRDCHGLSRRHYRLVDQRVAVRRFISRKIIDQPNFWAKVQPLHVVSVGNGLCVGPTPLTGDEMDGGDFGRHETLCINCAPNKPGQCGKLLKVKCRRGGREAEGGGLLIHPDLFAQTDFHLFSLR